jgi:hypothetical protein
MKLLHRPDLFSWSRFDEARNIDFHSVLWVRGAAGNVAFDPLPLTEHDARHLNDLGGVRTIIVTNSDHVRDAATLAAQTGAVLLGPAAERANFPVPCSGWLKDADEPIAGLRVFALEGSKTPGELALLLERTTLITGDLIRAHRGGGLDLLPNAKLSDVSRAQASLDRLLECTEIDAVLPGDGWPIFRNGLAALRDLRERCSIQPA